MCFVLVHHGPYNVGHGRVREGVDDGDGGGGGGKFRRRVGHGIDGGQCDGRIVVLFWIQTASTLGDGSAHNDILVFEGQAGLMGLTGRGVVVLDCDDGRARMGGRRDHRGGRGGRGGGVGAAVRVGVRVVAEDVEAAAHHDVRAGQDGVQKGVCLSSVPVGVLWHLWRIKSELIKKYA